MDVYVSDDENSSPSSEDEAADPGQPEPEVIPSLQSLAAVAESEAKSWPSSSQSRTDEPQIKQENDDDDMPAASQAI